MGQRQYILMRFSARLQYRVRCVRVIVLDCALQNTHTIWQASSCL